MRRPYLVLVAVCTGWGTIPLVSRWTGLPPAAIVFGRLAVAAASLGAAVALDGRRPAGDQRPPPLLRTHRRLFLAAQAVLAAHWLALFAAYDRTATGTVILVVYLAPVGIAALAPAVLGERLDRATVAALAVAAVGFALVAGPAAAGAEGAGAAGMVLALVAAALFVALVLLSKPLTEAYGGLRVAFLEMAGAAVVVAPVAAFAGWGEPRRQWAWLLVLGLVHTAVGTGLYLSALALVPATHVGILGYLEPASAVVVGWLVLDEAVSAATVLGGSMIVAAGALVVRAGPRAADGREVAGGVPG